MRKNKEAVSPVIGVILMVAITVILAAVVYLWVIGFMHTGKGTPTVSYTTSGYDDGFMVNIETATIKQSVKYIKYVLIDKTGTAVETGYVDNIYSKWSAKGVIFQDNNYNDSTMAARLAGGSIFKIEKAGGSHGGVAITGYQFQLIDTSTATPTTLFRASL